MSKDREKGLGKLEPGGTESWQNLKEQTASVVLFG